MRQVKSSVTESFDRGVETHEASEDSDESTRSIDVVVLFGDDDKPGDLGEPGEPCVSPERRLAEPPAAVTAVAAGGGARLADDGARAKETGVEEGERRTSRAYPRCTVE